MQVTQRTLLQGTPDRDNLLDTRPLLKKVYCLLSSLLYHPKGETAVDETIVATKAKKLWGQAYKMGIQAFSYPSPYFYSVQKLFVHLLGKQRIRAEIESIVAVINHYLGTEYIVQTNPLPFTGFAMAHLETCRTQSLWCILSSRFVVLLHFYMTFYWYWTLNRTADVSRSALVDGCIEFGIHKTRWTNTSKWHGTPNHHWQWKLHTGLLSAWILLLSRLWDLGFQIKWNIYFHLSISTVLFLLSRATRHPTLAWY